MKTYRILTAVYIVFACSFQFDSSSFGQTEQGDVIVIPRQVLPFHDGTYVFLNAPLSEIKFEAHLQPNLGWNRFSDTLLAADFRATDGNNSSNGTDSSKGHVLGFGLIGTPGVRLRLLNKRSDPVRTPSYMPKVTLTVFDTRSEKSDRVGLWAGQFTVGHHSNGQDGCLFTTDVLNSQGDCVGPSDPRKINTKDGSFSTNYVRFGGRYRREWLKPLDEDEKMGKYELTLGIDYDRHFLTDSRIVPFYSQNRGDVSVGAATHLSRVCKGRISITGTAYYIGRHTDAVGRSWAYQAESICTFSDESGWGLFAKYYNGQDYYNLGFAQSINRFMFGVHFDDDGFLHFLSPAHKKAIKDQKQRQESR